LKKSAELFIFVNKYQGMQKRINRIMNDKKLSASQISAMIGVQRSSISHILSGRNKPSLDFIQKLLNAFPDLNPAWLILGKGSMNISEEKPAIKQQTDLFDTAVDMVKSEDSAPYTHPIQKTSLEKEKSVTLPEEQKDRPIETDAKATKKVALKKIILVYEDQSFEELFPKKD